MSWKARRVPHPDRSGRTLVLFAERESASRHIRDHLLTAPECTGWALIDARYAELLDPEDGKQRLRIWRRIQKEALREDHPLYLLYSDAIVSAIAQAWSIGWHVHVEDGRQALDVDAALSPLGLLVIAEDERGRARPLTSTVRTAYLAGLGDSTRVEKSKDVPVDAAGFPRETESPMRAISHREYRAAAKRRASWSREERIYYDVFRPAVRFLRGAHYDSAILASRRRVKRRMGQYALLKNRIPSASKLKYEGWLGLTRQCGALAQLQLRTEG